MPGGQGADAQTHDGGQTPRLKRVVADLTLDRHILQEVLRKKV